MSRIVTTMTVIPTREYDVIKTIMSIKEGSLQPSAMYINIPKHYVRFKQKLEPWLVPVLESIGMKVILLDSDKCCFNKILPILDHEKDPETLVVTIDDDIIYSPMFIAGLYEGYKVFGNVVGYCGFTYPEFTTKNGGYALRIGHGSKTQVIQQGFGTMTMLSSFYDFPYIPPLTKHSNPSLYLSDDYVISRFYDFKKIDKYIICWDQIGRRLPNFDDWSSICTLQDTDEKFMLSSERKTFEDYANSKKIIDTLWHWPYLNT